jgi:hypothetical protein
MQAQAVVPACACTINKKPFESPTIRLPLNGNFGYNSGIIKESVKEQVKTGRAENTGGRR